MKKSSLGLLFLFGAKLCAEPLTLEYGSFYSHVRKLDDEDTKALQFSFGFKHVREKTMCRIDEAYIHTQKQDLPLSVSTEQRFLVPREKALKLARAQVLIQLQEPANLCDMSVQLETRAEYLKTRYSHKELMFLQQQYEAFFKQMGGFLSFLMPSTQGLVFHLSDSTRVTAGGKELVSAEGKLTLDKDWLAKGRELALTSQPLRITALTKQD